MKSENHEYLFLHIPLSFVTGVFSGIVGILSEIFYLVSLMLRILRGVKDGLCTIAMSTDVRVCVKSLLKPTDNLHRRSRVEENIYSMLV